MNKTSNYEFTIVVPVFNEEDNIVRLERAFNDYLPICAKSACVLFVDDGSTDNSLKGIQQICESNEHFFYIALDTNHGLSAAIKAGIDACQSPFVGYIDADLQTVPADFNKLLEYADNYALVSGIRAKRNDSTIKRLQSKIANRFRRSMTGDKATDTGCPLKVMHTSYARRIPFFDGMHRFLPALIALQKGGTFYEVPIRHFPRVAGTSKYHFWNRLTGPFLDCFAYRWMKSRYINYGVINENVR